MAGWINNRMWGLRVNEALGLTQAMQWRVEWKVMSLTKGNVGGFKRRRKDDG